MLVTFSGGLGVGGGGAIARSRGAVVVTKTRTCVHMRTYVWVSMCARAYIFNMRAYACVCMRVRAYHVCGPCHLTVFLTSATSKLLWGEAHSH